MQKRLFLTIVMAVAVISMRLATADPVHANGSPAAALTGRVQLTERRLNGRRGGRRQEGRLDHYS